MLSNLELTSIDFDTVMDLAPKCSDILYSNRSACALHELLDSIEGVKVLHCSEGRLSNVSDSRFTSFLEVPSISFAFVEEGSAFVEDFLADIWQIARKCERVIDETGRTERMMNMSIVYGVTSLLMEESNKTKDIPSVTIRYTTSKSLNRKDENVKPFMEEFIQTVWDDLLYAATEADGTRDFYSAYMSKPVRVSHEGEIVETSMCGRAIVNYVDTLGFEPTSFIYGDSMVSVRNLARIMTKSKTLFRMCGYMVSDGVMWDKAVKALPKNFIAAPSSGFFSFKSKNYKVLTLLLSDESNVQFAGDQLIVSDDDYGLTQTTFLVFSYLIGTDKLAYTTFFKSMSAEEVSSRFAELKHKPGVVDVAVSKNKSTDLFSEVFMDVDAIVQKYAIK